MNSENKGWGSILGQKPKGRVDITNGGKKGQSVESPILGPCMYKEKCLPNLSTKDVTNGSIQNKTMKRISPDRPEPGKQI